MTLLFRLVAVLSEFMTPYKLSHRMMNEIVWYERNLYYMWPPTLITFYGYFYSIDWC